MNNTENKHNILERIIYILTNLCVESFEGHARLWDWNLLHSVGQTSDMHSLWMEDLPKGKLFPMVRPMNRLIDDLTLLQIKIILKDLDSSFKKSTQWSLKLHPV